MTKHTISSLPELKNVKNGENGTRLYKMASMATGEKWSRRNGKMRMREEDKGKALADMYKVLFIMNNIPCLQMFYI